MACYLVEAKEAMPKQKEQARGLLTLRPTGPWDESAVEACKNCSIQIGTEHFIQPNITFPQNITRLQPYLPNKV